MQNKQKNPDSRRNALRLLAASGVATGSALTSNSWVRPVVESVLLPAHAQTSSDPKKPKKAAPGSLEDPCFLTVRCDGDSVVAEVEGQVVGDGDLSGIQIVIAYELNGGDPQTDGAVTDSDGRWGPETVTYTATSGTITATVSSPVVEFDPPTCSASFDCSEEEPEEEEGECKKIEGSDIGANDLKVDLGSTTITITSWTSKEKEDGESEDPDEYVGFTLDTDVCFVVKAGGDCFTGSGTSWSHPFGTSGPDAKGISNVTFCPPDDCPDIPGNCDRVDPSEP